MEKSKPVVVGIGELLWDVFPDVKKAGGAPINFVYHATQLGAEGYAISAVGNDVFGTEIIQELDKNGIDSNYISTVEYPTGSVMVELKNGIPSYTIIEGVAWDQPELYGFQYVDWQFDGKDIVFVSRTAWRDKTGNPPRQHDANYMTFHRIRNFRAF